MRRGQAGSRRTLLRDIQARLQSVPERAVTVDAAAPAPAWLIPALAELLRTELVCAYRPRADDGFCGLGDYVTSPGDTFFARYDAASRRRPAPFCYDPLHPEGEQRNRALMLSEIHTHGPDTTCVIDEVWPTLGIGGHDQLRALVCDGPVLLAWVGGFREDPFTRADRAALEALAHPMRRAFSLWRMLIDAGLAQASLGAALDALAVPAFVARRDGAVLHANASGRALHDAGPGDLRTRLRELISLGPQEGSVARIAGVGAADCFLVIVRDAHDMAALRLGEVGQRWRITRREAEVLARVVAGDANKEIALKLGVHEGSVERHVTSLLRKALCDSRSRLVARFWTGA